MTAKMSCVGLHVLQAGKQDDSDDVDDHIIAFLEAEMRRDPAWLEPTGFQDLVSRFLQLAGVPPKQVRTRKLTRPRRLSLPYTTRLSQVPLAFCSEGDSDHAA